MDSYKNKFAFFSGVTTLLLSYLAYRLQFTYDEGWSQLVTKDTHLLDIISYSSYRYANNHVLNSVFFKTLNHLSFSATISFRLLSLACFPAFSIILFRISRLGKTNNILVAALLFFSPLLGYFILGRGYALAITSYTYALYYLLTPQRSVRINGIFIAAIVIAPLSIFSYIYPTAAIVAVFLYQQRFWKAPNLHTLAVLLSFGFTAFYVYIQGSKVVAFDPNIPGSNYLTKSGTISSLLSLYTTTPALKLLILGATTVPTIAGMYFAVNNRLAEQDKTLTACIFLTLGALVAAHLILGTPYPLGRGAQYLLIPGLLLTASLLRNVDPRIAILTCSVLCSPPIFHLGQKVLEARLDNFEDLMLSLQDNELILVTHKPTPWLWSTQQRIGSDKTIIKYGTLNEYLSAKKTPHILVLTEESFTRLKPNLDYPKSQLQGGWTAINVHNDKLNTPKQRAVDIEAQ